MIRATRLRCPACGAVDAFVLTRSRDGRFVCPFCLVAPPKTVPQSEESKP
jgi:hypothetical protein